MAMLNRKVDLSIVSLNDEIIVKCIGVNEKGQIDLSRKDALRDAQKRNEKKQDQ